MTRINTFGRNICPVPVCALVALAVAFTLPAHPAHSALLIWDDGAGDDSWSSADNWDPDQAPGTTDDVRFDFTANNTSSRVETNTTIGSMIITLPPSSPGTVAHNLQIDSGATLTVTGNYTQGIGSPNCPGTGDCAGHNTAFTVSGDGTFAYDNDSGTFRVGVFSGFWNRGDRSDVLNLSALSTFTLDAERVEIGRVGAARPSPGARLILADTNTLSASVLSMTQWNDEARLELGRENNLHVDTFLLSSSAAGNSVNNSANPRILFQAGLTDPSVTIRAADGSSGANMFLSNNPVSGNSNVDFTDGEVDALFNTLNMSMRTGGSSGNAQSTLTFNLGTITTNALNMSSVTGSAGVATSTLNINGAAELNVNALTMQHRPAGTSANSNATLNLSGGILSAASIEQGATDGTGGGSLNFNFNSGIIRNLPGNDLTIGAGVPLNILTSGTHIFNAESGQSIDVQAPVVGSGTGSLIKQGDGTLLLNGANTYIAPTLVQAGTLGGTGSISSDVTVMPGATLAPGASFATFDAASLDMQDGSTLRIEIGGLLAGSEFDQVNVAGLAELGGTLEIYLANGFSPTFNDSFVVLQADDLLGTFSEIKFLHAGFFDISYLNNQVTLSNFSIPEPSSMILLLSGLVMLKTRRRRR